MKTKSIILCFLFSCMLTGSFAQTAKLRIDVDWGRPRFECHGFGVCGILISAGFGTLAEARLTPDQGTFILDVPFALTKGYEKQFTGPTFPVDEDYQIPADVCKSLGAKKQLVIRAGKHEMKKTDLGYTVFFKQ